MEEREAMTNQISRDEVRSAIEDKLCAHFGVTSEIATDGQIFQATAIVIRELMSRLLAAENPKHAEKRSSLHVHGIFDGPQPDEECL